MVSALFQYHPVAFLTLWHFQSVSECKVCNGVILKNVDGFRHTICISCIFKSQNAENAESAKPLR